MLIVRVPFFLGVLKAKPVTAPSIHPCAAQVAQNSALLLPSLSFQDFADRSWRVPQRFFKNRYMTLRRSVRPVAGSPSSGDQRTIGYDGALEENMVVSVESSLGADDGQEGIKSSRHSSCRPAPFHSQAIRSLGL